MRFKKEEKVERCQEALDDYEEAVEDYEKAERAYHRDMEDAGRFLDSVEKKYWPLLFVTLGAMTIIVPFIAGVADICECAKGLYRLLRGHQNYPW